MNRLRHMLTALAALLMAGLSVGCVYDHYPEEEFNGGGSVTLLINVGTAAPTRATASWSEKELIHSLRIVLLDAEGKIEYNTYIDGLDNVDEWKSSDGAGDTWFFRTTPGPKKIYIVANEDCASAVSGGGTLTSQLESRSVGESGFETFVNSLYFTPDFDKGLVLSSMYEFEIRESELDAGHTVTKEFWLVHVATKFDFRFENYRQNDVTIDDFRLSSVAGTSAAGDMYLMANLAESEKTKTFEGRKYYWIDWLREVCDETNAHPDLPGNENVNEKYGWITDYVLPSGSHMVLDVKNHLSSQADGWRNWTVSPGGNSSGALQLPQFYCSESKFGADASTGYQNYTFTITVTDTGDVENKTHTFENVALDNVKALFRNTHVMVTVKLLGKDEEVDLELRIGVCPWYSESIDIPTFD